jgi:DNA-directed RNA polymerase sigma subunit (sigma70/sigma32)
MAKQEKPENINKIINNFIKKYGLKKFKDMIVSFQTGESGQDIGDRLNVSRERVRQWKKKLGDEISGVIPSQKMEKYKARQIEAKDVNTVIKNFEKTHGRAGVLYMMRHLEQGTSGETIGAHFGLSRQRINQIKGSWGKGYRIYQLKPQTAQAMRRKK